uniref:Uncharacterized protein n=1 Tax=Amphimedon queenslandica TaxID=400682 RepID=A0A1X7UXL3_AMPQE
ISMLAEAEYFQEYTTFPSQICVSLYLVNISIDRASDAKINFSFSSFSYPCAMFICIALLDADNT